MKPKEVRQWVTRMSRSISRPQAKTLGALAAAALVMVRATLAELGRKLACQTAVCAKHCIKRVDRFVGNDRLEPIEAMRSWVRWFCQHRGKLLVSIDWVDVRSFIAVVLAARLKGRAIPLLWMVTEYPLLFRSMNNLEEGLLRAFRTMIPPSTEVVVLADRGFGRCEMARLCQELRLHYIVRIRPNVQIVHEKFSGNLLDLPIRRGKTVLLRGALYRKSRPVQQNIAVCWPSEQSEPWFLMTDLDDLPVNSLCRIFGKRMTIEQLFRDAKSLRNGFALRLTLIHEPNRFSRLLLILAVAYLVLVAIGLHAQRHWPARRWASNNRTDECSLFSIGRAVLHLPLPSLSLLLRCLRSFLLSQNWG